MIFALKAFCLLCLLSFSALSREFVLIIDDLGNNSRDLAFFQLPQGVTFSFLPHTPYADQIVEQAQESGRELMLHLPMEAHNGKKMGPGGLDTQMDEAEFRLKLSSVLDSYPEVKGVNNHMGSKLSELEQPMGWFVDEVQRRQLYFIDSKTSPNSVAEQQAEGKMALVGHRDLFLDHYPTQRFIRTQLQQVEQRMARGEIPVVLAHPYPETLLALRQLLPELLAKGVRIIRASQGLAKQKRSAVASAIGRSQPATAQLQAN